jgi:hypothetical protein
MSSYGESCSLSQDLSIHIYLEFLEPIRSPFDQISLNYFKLVQINAKTLLFIWAQPPRFLLGPAHACPRSPPCPLIGRPTYQWHRHPALCRGPPVSSLSPRSVRPARARAVHVACERRARAAAGHCPPVGAPTAPPRAAGHPHARDPHLFPPLSPLPRCRRAARSPLALLHSSSHPHSPPTPSLERPSFPTAPRTRTAVSGHRQPPLPHGFRPSTAAARHSPVSSSPSYQSLKFLANPSLPRLSRAAGLHHPRR